MLLGQKRQTEEKPLEVFGLDGWRYWRILILRGMFFRGLYRKFEKVTFLLITNEIERIWDFKCPEHPKIISY